MSRATSRSRSKFAVAVDSAAYNLAAMWRAQCAGDFDSEEGRAYRRAADQMASEFGMSEFDVRMIVARRATDIRRTCAAHVACMTSDYGEDEE